MLRSLTSIAVSTSRRFALSAVATAESAPATSTPSKRDVDELFKESGDQPKRRHAYSLNRVEIIGGVADTPLARVAKNGKEYAILTVITNHFDQTERHTITTFGKTAEFVKNNVTKGHRVLISGRLHYTGGVLQDDGTRTPRQTHIHGDNVQPLAKRSSNFQSEDH